MKTSVKWRPHGDSNPGYRRERANESVDIKHHLLWLWTICGLFILNIGNPVNADDWTDRQKIEEGTFLTLLTVDWLQTRYTAKHPDDKYETNRILSDHPTVGRVNTYFLLSGILQVGITNYLPSNLRDIFQISTIVLQIYAIENNISAGIRLDF